MRIAILFYGRILHFDKRFLLKKLDKSHEVNIFYACDEEPQQLVDDFIDLYEPVAIHNEKVTYSVDFSSYPNAIENIHNMTCHFINLKRVFQLLQTHISKTGITYDLVIATRLDLEIVSLELIQPEKNTLYVPYGEDYYGINDRFAMGDIDTMRHYMNIFDNCTYLLDNNLAMPHPEIINLAHIKHCELNIKRFYMVYRLYGREIIWCNADYNYN